MQIYRADRETMRNSALGIMVCTNAGHDLWTTCCFAAYNFHVSIIQIVQFVQLLIDS